jgi:hypothetical protein
MTTMTRDVLETATAELLGGGVAGFPLDRLHHLITLEPARDGYPAQRDRAARRIEGS